MKIVTISHLNGDREIVMEGKSYLFSFCKYYPISAYIFKAELREIWGTGKQLDELIQNIRNGNEISINFLRGD